MKLLILTSEPMAKGKAIGINTVGEFITTREANDNAV